MGETVHSNNGVMNENQMASDHAFLWIAQTCLQPYPHTTSTLCDPPLAARWAPTRHCMLSTRVITLLVRPASQAWGTACHYLAQWKGGHPCLGSRPLLGPKCSMGFMSGLRAGQPMTSTSCCARKAGMLHGVLGVLLSWTNTKFLPKNACRPWNHTIWRSLVLR